MNSFAWWPTVIVLAVATFTDLRSRRIPNWLVLPFLVLGISVSAWLHGWHGLGQSFEGLGLGFFIYGILFWLGGMGAGDVKLCAAIGAWIGPDQLFIALVITGLVGGVMVLGWALVRRIFKGPVHRHKQSDLRQQEPRTVSRSGDGARQSTQAQDALRAGNCNRNAYLILFPLRIGTKRHAGL